MKNMKNKLLVGAGLVGILSSSPVIANDLDEKTILGFINNTLIPQLMSFEAKLDGDKYIVDGIMGCGDFKHPYDSSIVSRLEKGVQDAHPTFKFKYFEDYKGSGPGYCVTKINNSKKIQI